MSRARDTKAVCRNPECGWQQESRDVRWPEIGPDIFASSAIHCSCGWAMELLPDPVVKVKTTCSNGHVHTFEGMVKTLHYERDGSPDVTFTCPCPTCAESLVFKTKSDRVR